jgi:N-acetyl-gamma-glutamylphosphate reductase
MTQCFIEAGKYLNLPTDCAHKNVMKSVNSNQAEIIDCSNRFRLVQRHVEQSHFFRLDTENKKIAFGCNNVKQKSER